MSGTVQEALKSDDIDLIKKTRTAFRGKLTRAANRLIDSLKKDDSGKFLLKEIFKVEVDSMLAELQNIKDTIDELHIRYTIKRVHKEGLEENKLENLDNDYAFAFEDTHRKSTKLYHAFCAQFEVAEQYGQKQKLLDVEVAQYPDKLRRFKACGTEYESALEQALLVIQSEDEYVKRTAPFQKEMLVKEYEA